MSRNARVIVAMSGGVDSSVAACLLKQQGYDCVGVFMRVGAKPVDDSGACRVEAGASGRDLAHDSGAPPGAQPPRRLRHGCCSATDAIDARAVAGRLGIPFYALNFEPDFEPIIDYFVDEYARGRTPNPCVQCNIRLKFGKLLRYADMLDAEFVATGHYARMLRVAGEPRLARARNRAKDQSYVLFGIARDDLPRCLFPLGDFADKAELRRMAADLGLRVHDKPDSQEICFVPGNDYRKLLAARRPGALRRGEIRDRDGAVVGAHNGVAAFTVGQRRGLGIARGTPAYVTRLDVLSNVVTIGSVDELAAGGLLADDMNWHITPPAPGCSLAASIKIRHMHAPAAGHIRRREDDCVEAAFDTPQLAVTPGQAAVFYDDADCVLGGGWIRAAESIDPLPGPA